MWSFTQDSGRLEHNGVYVDSGYSGYDDGDNIPEPGEGKNDPTQEAVRNIGPTPKGQFTIGPVHDTPTHGPCVMTLTPKPGTDTHGRSGFLIHGDKIALPGSASHGCIIFQRKTRERIAASGDQDLEVV